MGKKKIETYFNRILECMDNIYMCSSLYGKKGTYERIMEHTNKFNVTISNLYICDMITEDNYKFALECIDKLLDKQSEYLHKIYSF